MAERARCTRAAEIARVGGQRLFEGVERLAVAAGPGQAAGDGAPLLAASGRLARRVGIAGLDQRLHQQVPGGRVGGRRSSTAACQQRTASGTLPAADQRLAGRSQLRGGPDGIAELGQHAAALEPPRGIGRVDCRVGERRLRRPALSPRRSRCWKSACSCMRASAASPCWADSSAVRSSAASSSGLILTIFL